MEKAVRSGPIVHVKRLAGGMAQDFLLNAPKGITALTLTLLGYAVGMVRQFIVSPSLNMATIEVCRRYSVPIMSGALTPTEVLQAWTAGSDVVKVFPCGALGGASCAAPFVGSLAGLISLRGALESAPGASTGQDRLLRLPEVGDGNAG